MAPDRPDAAGVEDGRDCVVAGVPAIGRVFGFCEAFPLKEADHAAAASLQPAHFVETTALPGDEVVIEEEEEQVVPMLKQEDAAGEKPGPGPAPGQSDDELTSLSWLHQQNLLKGLEISEQPAARVAKSEVVVCDDSLDVSENTNSVSSLDDSYSHESTGRNSSADSATILNYDEVVINGTTGQRSGASPQEDARSPNGFGHQAKQLVNGLGVAGHNNNNNNSNSANYNLPAQSRNKHPTHIPYDPQLHKNCKPPYSFSSLIFMAIEDSPVKALPVKEVYAWILAHFPYFRNAPTGWKNSVRHNLSLNKCFRKVEKSPHLGKGSLWMVDAQYRPNLVQALSRTPCPPSTVMNINIPDATTRSSANNNNNSSSSINNNNNNNNNRPSAPGARLPDPVLFPYLSKRLASSSVGDCNNETAEFDSDVDAAAAAMLAFKHGPIILNHNKHTSPVERVERVERIPKKKSSTEKKTPVITRSSNEDHTYSLITSVRLERREVNNDVDEQRKIAEGADALLNLAGVMTTPPRDPLASDEYEVRQRQEGYKEIEPKFNRLYGSSKNAAHYVAGSDALEIRPVKRRSSSSSGEGSSNKRRKRFWKNTWTENGRYPKQVRG